MADKDIKNIFASLDSLLSTTNIEDVSAEGAGFSALPEGYYLCNVTDIVLGENKAKTNPQVKMQLKVIEDGIDAKFDSKDKPTFETLRRTKNRTLFKYYPLKDDRSVKSFVSDMLKFEGEEPGQPILGKEYFTSSELLEDALDVIKGMNIYIHITPSTNADGTAGSWTNCVSWKAARDLGLPE